MAAKMQRVEDLSPDGYSRFFILCDIIRQIYGGKKRKLKILDVGGGSEFMQQQLSKAGVAYDLTVMDIIERPPQLKVTYIQGDATAMDFKDNAFDIVLSTDVLEHVPQAGKQAFLDECLRVAGELCIIAAPFDTEGVNDAEIVVNDFNKKLFGSGQDWLEEHLALGKPSRRMFLDTLKKHRIDFDEFGTQNLTTWLLNTQINLIDAKLGLPHIKHVAANRFYNEHILEMNEFVGPTYRHFFVMYLNKPAKRFDTARYLTSPTDQAKLALYSNKLISLHADRIAELRRAERRLSEENYQFHETHAHDAQRIAELEAVVKAQQHTLHKLEPLMKVVRAPIIRKTRSMLGRKKG